MPPGMSNWVGLPWFVSHDIRIHLQLKCHQRLEWKRCNGMFTSHYSGPFPKWVQQSCAPGQTNNARWLAANCTSCGNFLHCLNVSFTFTRWEEGNAWSGLGECNEGWLETCNSALRFCFTTSRVSSRVDLVIGPVHPSICLLTISHLWVLAPRVK